MAEQRSTLVIEISSEQAARNARALDRELQSIERTGNYATTSMNSMSVAARQLAGYLAGVVTVGTAIAKMDTYTGLNNKLKLVTKSQSELNTAMNDTFKIAQNTAQAWDSVAQIYQRFSDNAQRLNITQAKTAELTDTVAKAIAISGGSAASAEAALVQFSQALASNVLRGEELNSVMEQAPGLAKAIAQGMGITVGQLRSVAAEGKITGDVLVDALTKARGSVNELFGKTDFTIAQSFTQLSNEVTKFVGEAGKGSGAAKVLSSSISALAENLAPIANAGAALAIGMLTKAMISNAAATTSATYSLIAKVDASIAERNANIAAAQAEVASAAAEAQSTQVTLTNIKATHAQIMAEIELEKVRLKAQITDQGRMATTTRMAQLGRLQAQVALEVAAAESAQTASSARLSAALTAQTVATSRLALAKSALMAIFSPMGLAIAATAATFYLLSSSSDEVKESLATQADSVESLTKKYLELNTVQALVEGVRLRKEIEQQNDVIDDASSATKRFAYIQKELFKLSGNDYADYQKAVTSIAKGASDAGDLLNKMIASGRFSQNQIDKLVEFSGAVAESKNKIEQNNNALKLLNATSGQHVEVTADSIKQLTIQTNLTKVATQNFTDMKTQMLDSLQAQVEFIRLNGGSEEQVNSLNKVIQAYSLNQLTATDAVKKFNSSAKVPSDVIKGLIDYASKTDQSKFAMNQANTELKAIQENGSKAKQGFIDASQGASTAMSEVDKLNEKMKEFNKTIAQRKFDAGYQQILISQYGKTPEQAAAMLKVRKDAEKIGLKNPTADMLKNELSVLSIENKLKDTIEAKSKAEKDRTKELERQQKLQEQTIKSKTIDSVIARGEGNYNSFNKGKAGDSVGSKLNLVDMTVGQIRSLQKNGSIFAAGKYQTIPSTLQGAIDAGIVSVAEKFNASVQERIVQQYLLTAKKDRGNIEDYIKGKNDNLTAANIDLSKEFASVANPLTGKSYYDGKAGNKASISVKDAQNALKASRELYAQAIASGKSAQEAWKSAFNSSISFIDGSKTQKDIDKYTKEQMGEAEQIQKSFRTKSLQEEQEYRDQLKKIRENSALSGDEKKIYEAQLTSRFEAQKKLNTLQQDYELNGYKYTESQKLQYTYDTNVLRLDAEGKYSDEVKAKYIKAYKELHSFELIAYKQLQLDKLNEFKASLEQQTGELQRAYLDTLAQNRMSQPQFAMWQFQNQFKGSINTAYDSYQNSIKGIYKKDEKDQYLIDAETRNEMLIAAEKNLEAQLLSIKMKGVEDERALRRTQLNDQLSMWGGILSTGQNTFSQLAQSAKDGLGEQSSTYRTMFAMQQAFSVASSMVAAWTAYTTAFADPSAMTLTQKFAGGAAVMAALMPALTTIGSISMQGFATGGLVRGPGTSTSDSIPAYLSNGEHVATAWAVNRIGVSNYDYMNRTGELPFQREYEALKSQLTMPGTTEAPKRFAEGGIIGTYNPDFERKQFEAMSRSNQQSQAHQPQTVENVVKVIVVKDEEEAKEHLYGKDGEKAFLYHLNRNKSKIR